LRRFPLRLLVIDNYDSFTYNLVQYFEELGATCDVQLNDATSIEAVARTLPHGVVLSPGPGNPDDAGICLALLAELVGAGERGATKVPFLGVCLGLQVIGQHFGARVRRASAPVHGRAWPVEHTGLGVLRGLPSPFLAARYHSLVLDPDTLPAALEVTARTPEGDVMAVRHRSLPVEGVQFHPESVLSQHGKALLANWLETLPS
jgi:anthranilate synthase/aminodeoxychorismate synthase-like glutamine amidotransferase